MILDIILTLIAGILAGGIVNLLADDLPYRRSPGVPSYADGTPRPVIAWLGITAFLFGKRLPDTPQPNEKRARPHRRAPELSWRYPLTEICTAGFMLVTLFVAPDISGMNTPQLIFYMVYMALFALITVIDLEHKLILFVVIIPSIALALLNAFLIPSPGPSFIDALIGATIGFGVFLLLYLGGFAFVWFLNRSRENKIEETAFGYGDVMLMTFTGALLGGYETLFAIFYTVIFGALGALLYLIAQRVLSGRNSTFDAIPYGPYIVAATILMLLFGHVVIPAMF
jgi:prepilin signal peptidase PulO-like enzyme (type II secretory pathway)